MAVIRDRVAELQKSGRHAIRREEIILRLDIGGITWGWNVRVWSGLFWLRPPFADLLFWIRYWTNRTRQVTSEVAKLLLLHKGCSCACNETVAWALAVPAARRWTAWALPLQKPERLLCVSLNWTTDLFITRPNYPLLYGKVREKETFRWRWQRMTEKREASDTWCSSVKRGVLSGAVVESSASSLL